MIDPQTKVIAQVIQERKNQDRQWGGPTHDDEHLETSWLDFIAYQMGKIEGNPENEKARQHFIKIAALAVAAVESLDRKSENEQAP